MFMRRLLEVLVFGFYWIGLGFIAVKKIYHEWLVQELEITEKFGKWSSLFIFLLILLIVYIIIRRIVFMIYAKCKLSEKHLLANLKKECRDIKLGIKHTKNVDIESSTLDNRTGSTKTFLSNEIGARKYGKSMENLSTVKMPRLMNQSKSLENIVKPVGTANRVARSKIGNTNHKNSVKNSAGNSKSENAIYEDLTESLKHAILKSSKSMDTVDGRNDDTADACVEDLLKIYENFYKMQYSQDEKRPIRKAPPVPIHKPD